MHGFHHLAKVRVAGSNPVVRSKEVQFRGLEGARTILDSPSARVYFYPTSASMRQHAARRPW